MDHIPQSGPAHVAPHRTVRAPLHLVDSERCTGCMLGQGRQCECRDALPTTATTWRWVTACTVAWAGLVAFAAWGWLS